MQQTKLAVVKAVVVKVLVGTLSVIRNLWVDLRLKLSPILLDD